MAISNITDNVYIIFTHEDLVHFIYNDVGECTSYNNAFWTAEILPDKPSWINRLNELGVDTSEL